MKAKVTQKYIKTVYEDIFSVGYCNAWYLLWNISPFAYNSGVYGWNCDYYNIGGVIICTGYRPHGKSGYYFITDRYNNLARAIIEDRNITYDEKAQKVEDLRQAWIAELLKS